MIYIKDATVSDLKKTSCHISMSISKFSMGFNGLFHSQFYHLMFDFGCKKSKSILHVLLLINYTEIDIRLSD